jgi:Predicted metal-dependent protease of the PAD1/JAB1 superfamily
MPTLYLPEKMRCELEERVRAGYPYETCGLLIGHQSGGNVEVIKIAQVRNLNTERAHDRYELDSEAFIAVDTLARQESLEVIGVWHSHPDHPAVPSETDRAAAWEGWSYVIVSVSQTGIADMRSWRLNGERFQEEVIKPCRQSA